MSPTPHASAAMLALAVSLLGAPSFAAPDPATVAELNASLSRASLVRVTGGFGSHRLRDVRLDDTGIAAARWGEGSGARPAIFVGSGEAPPERPPAILWRDIARLETGRHRAVPVGVAGAAIGAALGYAVVRLASMEGDVDNAEIVVALPALALGGLGALIGRGSYRWETVYSNEAR